MSAVKMFKASLSLLLITFTHGLFRTYNGSGPVSGQTPCCLDRMTTVSCNRLQLLNPNLFLFNCVHSADFAFVQCCKSCFDIKSSFSLNLDYSKIADVLLTNPQTAICNDRRGEEWCERLVKRRNFWGLSRYKQLDCSSMPFAFRVCRKSCGYCSNGSDRVGAIYDIKIATDPSRCNNPSYGLALPRKISENVRKLENRYTKTSTTVTTTEMPTPTTTTEPCTKATTLRPTTTTKNIETPPTTIPDFFVVTDQNYIDADDTQINDFDDWWSKRKGPYYLRLFKNQP